MAYIGRAATNAGSVNYLDDISSGFDGSDTTFTCAVKGTTITPGQENVYIYLDGVFQHPSDAYSISGSTITFTEAPVNGTDFTAYVAGEGAYLDDGTVSTAKLNDDAVTASKLDDDGTGFQVGDLGVGGSLTSGDKLTVTGRLRASGGIIGDLTGNVTGNASGTALTVTQAAQTAITSVGTLTGLTIENATNPLVVGSGTKDLYFDPDSNGVMVSTATSQGGDGHYYNDTSGEVWTTIDGTAKVKVKASAFEVTPNATFAGTINSTIANTQTHSENTEPNSTTEFLTLHNNSGSDGAHTDKYVTMKMAVGGGGTSEGHLIYRSSADNQGEFIFNSRHAGSTYNDILTLKSDKSATFAGDVTIGDKILYTASDYLKFAISGTDRLWISDATDNWGLNYTGNSPYGMQITTTASNSSSHDMFKVKRGDGTTCIETWGDGNTKIENEIQTKGGLRTYATNGASPTGDSYNVPQKFFTYLKTVTSTHVGNGYADISHGIARTQVLGAMVNHFGYAASNVNNMGYNASYITSSHLYAGGTLRVFIGSSVVAGDYIYITMVVHGNTG